MLSTEDLIQQVENHLANTAQHIIQLRRENHRLAEEKKQAIGEVEDKLEYIYSLQLNFDETPDLTYNERIKDRAVHLSSYGQKLYNDIENSNPEERQIMKQHLVELLSVLLSLMHDYEITIEDIMVYFDQKYRRNSN